MQNVQIIQMGNVFLMAVEIWNLYRLKQKKTNSNMDEWWPFNTFDSQNSYPALTTNRFKSSKCILFLFFLAGFVDASNSVVI